MLARENEETGSNPDKEDIKSQVRHRILAAKHRKNGQDKKEERR